VDRDFSDDEHFGADLKLASDDLGAVALTLERRFNVKIERRRHRDVLSVNDYVEVMMEALAASSEG
jgi:hypothetical protein